MRIRVPSGEHQSRLASLIHAMHGENVLGKVDSNGYDSHETFPSKKTSKLMKDGEVLFIR
jgi:hypothetical protein